MQKPTKIILGIDPGTVLMGYSVIVIDNGNITMSVMNALKLPAKEDNYKRLERIYYKISELIEEFKPHCFAIEAPFFGKNVQSMLKLGRAQGVAIAAAMAAGLEVCEYSPRKIKQSITGNGNADKEQVWKILQSILSLKDKEMPSFDASDALAVAVCHHFQDKPGLAITGKKLKGWADFVAKNPGKLLK